MSRFFISYSHADRNLAERIRKTILLVDHGHDVFLDRFGLTVGSDLKADLAKRIEWCDFLILILSTASLKSKWVKFELNCVRKCERLTGQKKHFVVQRGALNGAILPRDMSESLILEFTTDDVFPAEFFRLLHGIYQRPTFYRVKHDVRNDDAGGYLFDMWIECSREFAGLIDFVEYRFDYEFDYDGYNKDRIGGAVHKETNRASKFRLRGLWTSESITVFVAIYLRNTRVVYFRESIDVGTAIN